MLRELWLIGEHCQLAFASRIKSYHTWQAVEAEAKKMKVHHEKLRKQGKIAHDRIGPALAEIAEVRGLLPWRGAILMIASWYNRPNEEVSTLIPTLTPSLAWLKSNSRDSTWSGWRILKICWRGIWMVWS